MARSCGLLFEIRVLVSGTWLVGRTSTEILELGLPRAEGPPTPRGEPPLVAPSRRR